MYTSWSYFDIADDNNEIVTRVLGVAEAHHTSDVPQYLSFHTEAIGKGCKRF